MMTGDASRTLVTRPIPPAGRNRHSDRIAAGLRDDILRGIYKPGQRLPAERELASRLSVNRGSVREALKKLEQLGLVEIRRGDGALVRHLHQASLELLRDLLHVGGRLDRRVLEEVLDVHEMLLAGAAALAVERLSDASLARARTLIRELFAKERSAYDFHLCFEALVEIATEASGHLVLRLFRNTFQPVILDGMSVLGPYYRDAENQIGDIAEELDATLASRAPEAAAGAVRALMRRFRDRLDRALDAYEADRARERSAS